MRKKLLSIILSLAMVLTMIPAMGSVAYADETGKTVITTIQGTSNISEVLVLGKELKNPTITITSGSPATYNTAGNMNWYRKENGNWVKCENYTTVIPGEYCIKYGYFGVYNTTPEQYYNSYDLSNETTVTIDGYLWDKVGSYISGSSYCYIQRTSPVYTVENDSSKRVISSVDLEYDKVYYDGTAKEPNVTVEDLDGNVLEKDVDYTVTYSDNTNLTTYAKVTVEGINANGVYGTYIKYFKIELEPVVEKTKISDIEGTTNIAAIAKYGEPVTNPSITITSGTPASYNDAGHINWMKKQEDGSWVGCESSDVFTEGEYRLSCRFGVYNSNFDEYVLDDSATVTLDGETWEIDRNPAIYGTYSAMSVLSPVFKVTIPVKLSTTTYTYNGKVKSPSLTVKDINGNTLVKGTDYTVTVPSGRKNVGTYTYDVTFQGKYDGTESVSFVINPATPSIKSIKSGKKKMTVKMTTKPSSKGASTYQIYYKQKGTSTWEETTTTSYYKTIKSLKKGKYYYVKVRAYKEVGATTYYGEWSKTKLSKKIK